MTRQYEVVYIFDSALEEAQISEKLERFHAQLKSPERAEPVTTVSHWGKRTLAYPIKGKPLGYYVVAQFETQMGLLPEYERAIKLDESVLRHLVVLNDGLSADPAAARERVGSGDDARDDQEDDA